MVRRTKNRPTWAAFAGVDTRVSERRTALVNGGFNLIRGCACKRALGCASREIPLDQSNQNHAAGLYMERHLKMRCMAEGWHMRAPLPVLASGAGAGIKERDSCLYYTAGRVRGDTCRMAWNVMWWDGMAWDGMLVIGVRPDRHIDNSSIDERVIQRQP